MKRTAIYSRSRHASGHAPPSAGGAPIAGSKTEWSPTAPSAAAATTASRVPRITPQRWIVVLSAALLSMALFIAWSHWPTGPLTPASLSPQTLRAIDAEVRRSLSLRPLPSAVAHAYERIAPSVVRVAGLSSPSDTASPEGIGTGVVIVDDGTILTNLHVVQRAKRVKVMFSNGHESVAEVLSVDAANDLAVLRAKSIPDDLQAATLRSTADLRPGDEVLTVGFPFGIGPSVSSGVVSGVRREYRAQEGQQAIRNLIQFDAAANPGNSGGPLLTLDGEVVGIVTAILNPAQQRVFIGIGFAVPIENATAGAGLTPF